MSLRTVSFRFLTAMLLLSGLAFAHGSASAATTNLARDLDKDFEDLTPSEKIAIRAAAKVAYKEKKGGGITICADPGNMPFSNDKLEGFENKLGQLLGNAMGARVSFFWRPFFERGLARQTFEAGMCDVMIDVPPDYEELLTTNPVYRTTYVLAYRNDKGINIKNFDDPALKKLRVGVFQTSGVREALMRHSVIDNVSVHTLSHDADLNEKDQPWYQVQQVVNGDLDIAAVWGPFAGWVKSKGAPLVIQPVNLWDDNTPLEFDLAIGVRKTDVLLKYMLDFALDDKKDEVEKLLRSYGFPLVQCSRCVVQGDLPAHGYYNQVPPPPPEENASSDEAAAKKKVEEALAEGADPNEELSNAVDANDIARVKILATKGADVNKLDSQGHAALHSAARQRHADMVAALIDLHADVNRVDADGMTPLLVAAMRDDVPSIKLLLAHGANLEKATPEGFAPLALAIVEDHYEAAKVLMEAGADVNTASGEEKVTPLMIAAGQSGPAEGEVFLPDSTRPLDVARGLIERGAKVNAQSTKGVTALMVAAAHNNPPMIGLLLQSGANAALKDNDGKTAIEIAEQNGNQESARAISVLGTALSNSTSAPAGQSSKGGSGE